MKILFIFVTITLTGCAQFGARVTMPDGSIITERAYIAQQQFKSEEACHNSRAVKIPDNPTTEQVLAFAVASMAAQNAKPCAGTNSNDAAIAKSKVRWGFAGSMIRALAGAYSVGELADFGKTLATSRTNTNTTYNTEFGDVTQSNSTTGSVDGSPLGEGGGFESTENGQRTNTINIGGNTAIAGERAASGHTALVNGDSSLQSFIEGSELKQSPLADEQNDLDNSNGEGFGDNDGGNGVSLDL